MTQALWITLIGMGLVFLAIFLLWGLMALLVRLTEEKAQITAPLAAEPAPAEPDQPDQHAARRKHAAAAAVAVALALRQQAVERRNTSSGANISAWQAAHRAARLQPPTRSPRKASR